MFSPTKWKITGTNDQGFYNGGPEHRRICVDELNELRWELAVWYGVFCDCM